VTDAPARPGQPDVVDLAIGDAIVTAVCEATARWSPRFADRAEEAHAIAFQVVLLRWPGACVLVDAGLGDLDRPWARRFATAFGELAPRTRLVDALAARGLGPDDVTHVILTHAHLDHLAGATDDGAPPRPRFGRARHIIHARDLASPRHDGRRNPDGDRWLAALDAAGLLTPIDGPVEPVPGLRVEPAPGESPGHLVVWLRRGGQTFAHLADLVHVPAELADLALIPAGRDPVALRAARARVLAEVVAAEALVTFSHARAPFGTLVADGPGYRWCPLQ
jgi:glyoxylase-like metal-dependent hydrolase (beta-lactamase superfamily II)